MKIKKVEMIETLKAIDLKGATISKAKIISIALINTRYGDKYIMNFSVGDNKNSVFLNTISVNNLIEAFGDDTDKWTEKNKGKDRSTKTRCQAWGRI